MNRPTIRALFLAASMLLLSLSVGGCGGAEGASLSTGEPAPGRARSSELEAVATVRQIMDAMVIPTSARIWAVAGEAPADEAAWVALRDSAALVAEAGNLLLVGERAKDDEVWISTAKQMREAGARALAAVEARDVEAINEAGNVLIDACEICHESHLPR